jgi:hypothetical protein
MKNIDKYKDEILAEYEHYHNLGFALYEVAYAHGKMFRQAIDEGYDLDMKTLLAWLSNDYHEPLLADEEKDFLQHLLKYYKADYITFGEDYFTLAYEDDREETTVSDFMALHSYHIINDETYNFFIPKDLKFKNIELLKKYTLKELGL